jgi:predicted nuclease of predicted toxin-antitoxin system
VRFLIDENLSPRICALLITGGHHATHIRDHGMASASDPQVLAKAAAERLTLITADRGDFGRELALTRAVEPSVVLLRQLPDVVRAAEVAALVLANLTPAVASALSAGAFVVLTPTAVRVRHLPLR